MKTVAIIQARINSTRLPGKVMKKLGDKTVLAHVISRVQSCSLVDEVVVATTTSPADDRIVSEATKYGVRWFRGSEDDVLERYYIAAKEYKAEVIVRVTSDCPLFDPEVLLQMLNYFNTVATSGLKLDYLSNTLTRSYPRGLDAEIFTFSVLEQAFQEAHLPYEREHVTPFIYNHPERFVLHSQMNNEDLSFYRWTLDTEEDFKLLKEIYNALHKDGCILGTDEVVSLFQKKPELVNINAHVEQKKLAE